MYTKGNPITAYKVFDPDFSCRGFKFEVGGEYHQDGEIVICENGFHSCLDLVDCFNYYDFSPENKVAVVHAWGSVDRHAWGDSKICSSDIVIVKELTWHDVLTMCNTGSGNSGNRNSGDENSGNWNSGNRNSGNRNSGDENSGNWNSGKWNSGDENSGNWNSGNWNSGKWNSGKWNSGNRNSGDWNSGNRNSGDWNSGDWNSGDWNSCNCSSGFFNSEEQLVPVFNGALMVHREDFITSENYRALYDAHFELTYIAEDKTIKEVEYKEACAIWWSKMPTESKELVKQLPGFDAAVFKEITGIEV